MTQIDRRDCLKSTAAATALLGAGCIGQTGSSGSNSSGSSGNFESEIKAATLIDAVGSNYVTTSIETLKKNIESETNGEISVQTFPAGQIGSDETGIMKKVQQGTIELGDTSVQNFTPVAPSFDIKNLPYFAGKNQEYVNLVTSQAWTDIVEAQARDSGFEMFSYGFNDPRCWAPGNKWEGQKPPLTPAQLENAGVTQRTGGSQFTNTAFNILNANPTPVSWSEATTALQQGTVNAMYNAPQYHANSGFEELLSHEVIIKAVHDGRVWAMNRGWFKSLPEELQQQVKTAGNKTMQRNAEQASELRKNAVRLLRKNGIKFHLIEGEQLEKWKDTIAYDRNSKWNELMNQVFPSQEAKTKLEKATQQQSDIEISSLSAAINSN
jgi:TRAP-type C4-dicarboxylate transport system substrate-binding protein